MAGLSWEELREELKMSLSEASTCPLRRTRAGLQYR